MVAFIDTHRDEYGVEPIDTLWVADFTYVATRKGFVYVAFVVDVFTRSIVGWRVSSSIKTNLVLDALAESIFGLCKIEVIWRKGPSRNNENVEVATLEWVDWFNSPRLLEPIGNVPPAEFEQAYYRQQESQALGA